MARLPTEAALFLFVVVLGLNLLSLLHDGLRLFHWAWWDGRLLFFGPL